MAVLWVNNQSGCKGLCDRIPNVSIDGEQLDEAMLLGLDERIAALPAERRAKGIVVVLHQMGSHGPAYYKRSPQALKAFQPECTNHALAACSRDSVVNAYDNSIRYTDYFLVQVVAWLKTKGLDSAATKPPHATAMMYVSDHGESLGENNLYLHGLPYAVAPDFQKHVPWVTWLSPNYVDSRGFKTSCAKNNASRRITHDAYFHTVLGLTGIQTSLYQPALDIFSACK
jgi:lipid A ethanolaminephosphotransferase